MADKFPHQFEIFKKKADADLSLVCLALSFEEQKIDLDIVFFHLQQAVEKYLKTLISLNGVHFEKIHDIQKLISVCGDNSVLLPEYIDTFVELNPYAVEGRYAVIADDMAEAEVYEKFLSQFKLYVEKAIDSFGSAK